MIKVEIFVKDGSMIYTNTFVKELFEEYLTAAYGELEQTPMLNVVQVGEDFVSNKYVAMKQKLAKRIGSELKWWKFDDEAKVAAVQAVVDNINPADGLIYQIPIPARFDGMVEGINPYLDVDLLGAGYSILENEGILSPTIGAIDLVLKHIFQQDTFDISVALQQKMNLEGTRVAIVGQGKLVGKPLARYLVERNATVVSVNIDTVNPQELTSSCDIVISAAGKGGLIDKTWVKPDAILIDAATSEGDNALVGDVDKDNIYDTNVLCTTPKGVGGITVLYLFYNLLRLHKFNNS